MYTITLHDGTTLENLKLNGNNYIAEGIIEDSVFENNLQTVIVKNGENTEIFNDLKLVSNYVENGQSWFVLIEKTAQQKKIEELTQQLRDLQDPATPSQLDRIESQIAYLAMMTDNAEILEV